MLPTFRKVLGNSKPKVMRPEIPVKPPSVFPAETQTVAIRLNLKQSIKPGTTLA
jgi:hypothetical protein